MSLKRVELLFETDEHYSKKYIAGRLTGLIRMAMFWNRATIGKLQIIWTEDKTVRIIAEVVDEELEKIRDLVEVLYPDKCDINILDDPGKPE